MTDQFEFSASAGPAADAIDLLTVILHELGHVLSQQDAETSHDLMNHTLDTGIRRIPNAAGLSFEPQSVVDSAGREFWLTFPTNLGLAEGNSELALFISARVHTTGSVTIPGLKFSKAFTVQPGQTTKVTLPREVDLGFFSDRVTRKGVHVVADDDVTVYGMSRAPESSDAFLALPIELLGTEHIVLAYQNLEITPQVQETFPGTEFALVATEDDTVVTITPSVTTGVHQAGSPYAVELDQGETYLLQNFGLEPADLSGTILLSNQPIAVFGGHAAANVPAPPLGFADHLVEQLPPVESWGQEFLTVPFAGRNGDTLHILAASDGTEVSINGALVATLNRGELHEQVLPEASQIAATAPVLVAQYAHSAQFDDTHSDPFMMLVQPLGQVKSDYTVFVGSLGIEENYLNLVVPEHAAGAIRLNEQFVPADEFTPIGATGYAAATLAVAAGSYDLSAPVPFAAYVYGFGLDQSYGYPAGLTGIPQTPVAVAGISLTPEMSDLTVGSEQVAMAEVLDQSGAPVEGIGVGFEITGANPATSFALTDATGKVTFAYDGINLGSDLIVATVGAFDDQARVYWIGQAPTITLTGPEDSSLLAAGSSVLITGQALPGPATSIVLVSVNGLPVGRLDGAGNFFTQVDVLPGVNEFEITAFDGFGQTVTTHLEIRGTQPTETDVQFELFSTNLSASLVAQYGRTSFAEDGSALFAELSVRNQGNYRVERAAFRGYRQNQRSERVREEC